MALFRRELPTFTVGGKESQLIVRTNTQARRMRLSVDPRDGSVRLTLPKTSSLKAALDWAEERRSWIEGELARIPVACPIMPGGTLMFEGRQLLVDWRPNASRLIRREADRLIQRDHPGGRRGLLSRRGRSGASRCSLAGCRGG